MGDVAGHLGAVAKTLNIHDPISIMQEEDEASIFGGV